MSMMASQVKKAKRDKLEQQPKVELSKSTEVKDTRSLCERVQCPLSEITCIVEGFDGCVSRGGHVTAHSWYHLSPGEHVCNNCLEFYSKSQSIGYSDFSKWKKIWSSNGRADPLVSTYISDQILPYWLQCNRCLRWRELGRFFAISRAASEQFICSNSCDEDEDQRVQAAKQSHWIDTLLYPPYLTQSPAALYLKDYYPDAVGMSASEPSPTQTGGDNVSKPFHDPHSSCNALSLRPDVMDLDETLEFPEFSYAQHMYLCLRNLVVALWAQSSAEWITLDKCRHSAICRGLIRVRCIQELERIIQFLTSRSVINHGLLPHPPPSVFAKVNPPEVIIVGAGISGLAAAQHLYKQGIQATVLEARERLGGRIHNTRLSNGLVLSLGPDIINGTVNNPIALMARQAKLIVQEYPVSPITVIGKTNKALPADLMRKVENRFLLILDLIHDWSKTCKVGNDCSLKDKITEIHKKLLDEEEPLSEEEELVFNMYLGLLEMPMGCEADKLSAIGWNAHENFAQFSGPSFIIKHGLGGVLDKMAAPVTVHYRKQVVSVNYNDHKIIVKCSDGDTRTCSKVILCVPLYTLKNQRIAFQPPLPGHKLEAIHSLACGAMEKVVMHFKKKFWAPKMHGIRLFTSTSILADPSSAVHIFYDMSSNAAHILTAYIYGDKAVSCYSGPEAAACTEKIAERCLDALRKIFPLVPNPITVTVSRWMQDDLTGMLNCYIPVGVSSECMNILAQTVDKKVYFAGELTCQSHPRSVTGAYLSGVREAIKVLSA